MKRLVEIAPPKPWRFLWHRPGIKAACGLAFNAGHWMVGFEVVRGGFSVCLGPFAFIVISLTDG